MEEILLFLSILIAGFSLLLFIVSIIAYSRIKSVKLLIISFAFLAFTVKGVLLLLEFISQDMYATVIDFVVLVLLYLATAKK